ncbi:MAG: UbiA family prenyltransferase [Bacteroidales bacterium]|nr:UbiA family prenyltransferase [Bacteroidales bacterium]
MDERFGLSLVKKKIMCTFFRLIRWQTLLFLILTQFLVKYGIVAGLVPDRVLFLTNSDPSFIFLVISTALLAAAGFVINDYFDVKNDLLVKPERVMVDVKISRNKVILLHTLLNVLGVICGITASILAGNPWFSFIFVVLSLFLFYYSARLHHRVVGSVFLIATFPLIAIGLVWLFEFSTLQLSMEYLYLKIARVVAFYAFFSFISVLLILLVKQMDYLHNEMEDDRSFIATIGKSKGQLLIFILIFLCAGLLLSVAPLLFYPTYKVTLTVLALVLILLGYAMFELSVAFRDGNYSRVSFLLKVAVLIGVLSMFMLNIL